ncbi:MAG: hypothetical protein RDU89_06205 [bacterium]|nr:hypothetical protein [bacterium]
MTGARVYHASPVRGLTRIEARASTHGKWVYATVDKVMAALFLSGAGGDLTCQVGRDGLTGRPYVCERLEGAFEHRYLGRQGSIYVLPGDGFSPGMTPWDEEVVRAEPVIPIEEIPVPDVAGYLRDLARRGDLIIALYPERIDGIPADDGDLVEKVARWARRFGLGVLEELEQYHPHLVDRVKQALADRRNPDEQDP